VKLEHQEYELARKTLEQAVASVHSHKKKSGFMATPECGHFPGDESALLLPATQLRSLPVVLHGRDREGGTDKVR
jgi:hypothetical protein